MPMVAMFIIFDFIIKNPLHPETRTNLSFLDIVAAHFARLDLASEGTLHDTKVAEFTSIARLYVERLTKDQAKSTSRAIPNTASHVSSGQTSESNVNLGQASSFLMRQSSIDVSETGNTDMVSGYFLFFISSSLSVSIIFLSSIDCHHCTVNWLVLSRSTIGTVRISRQRQSSTLLISPT